ncbi:hypothetical protein C3492_36525 [Streptomyces sp. Ru62]|uniref:CoA transferase n=1 Tax=Streptomyces sp. Ru62 TaxID=2080745 RepID=UPI000CDD0FB0|nr:CoA transferase [Streptomyces sp. Ru62]POX58716.1 hypothetical protein C3492_36525 [Streptomyces sp. Ru62]
MTQTHIAGPLESVRAIDLSTVVIGLRRTRDGLAAVISYNRQNFRHFFSATDRPDLAAAPRVDGSALDLDDVDDRSDLVDECAHVLTTTEWAEVCHLLDPVVRPAEGPLRTNGIAVLCSATPGSIRRLVLVPRRDTAHVLAALAATR